MLKLLEFTKKIWGSPDLSRVAIIGSQHIMESTLELFISLKSSGLNPKNTYLIGKCYSTSHSVYQDFLREGIYVDSKSFEFNSHIPFDIQYKRALSDFLSNCISKINSDEIDRIIVLDDGGYLISQVDQLKLLNKPVICIEQTSAGYNFLKERCNLEVAVLNVARSKAKLDLETPFIVESALDRLFSYIPKEKLKDNNVLVLGKGAVGLGMARQLAHLSNFKAYDPTYDSPEHFHSLVSEADIIIGCSGYTSLTFEKYSLLKPGVVLASVSSSDREFDASHFRKQMPVSLDCRANYVHKGITLLQSGCPLNFWGSRNNMDLNKIQITLSLLMSAIFQAANLDKNTQGFVSLDEENERLLSTEFTKILSELKLNEVRLRVFHSNRMVIS